MYLLGMGAGSPLVGELGVGGVEAIEVVEAVAVAELVAVALALALALASKAPSFGAAVLSARSALALSGLGSKALSGRPTNMWMQDQNQHTPLQPNLLST